MQTIIGQVIAGTRVDAHAERNTLEMLETFARHHAGKRLALNQQHNLALSSPGHMENLRVIPDHDSPGDWCLVADITYETDALRVPVRGFSISFLEVLRPSSTVEDFQVFLPYPHYNDSALLDEVFVDGYVSVGRWAKKSAETDTVAIVAGVIVFVLTPLWTDLYQKAFAPRVERFFLEHFPKFAARRITADFVQHLSVESSHVEVHFVPKRGDELHCFSAGKTTAAMFMVHDYLIALDINHVPVRKMVVIFDEQTDLWRILRVEFTDGSVSGDV